MYGNLKPKPRASFVKRNVESYQTIALPKVNL